MLPGVQRITKGSPHDPSRERITIINSSYVNIWYMWKYLQILYILTIQVHGLAYTYIVPYMSVQMPYNKDTPYYRLHVCVSPKFIY